MAEIGERMPIACTSPPLPSRVSAHSLTVPGSRSLREDAARPDGRMHGELSSEGELHLWDTHRLPVVGVFEQRWVHGHYLSAQRRSSPARAEYERDELKATREGRGVMVAVSGLY